MKKSEKHRRFFKRNYFISIFMATLLVACTSNGGPQSRSTSQESEELANRLKKANDYMFSAAALPTTDEIGTVLRESGKWGTMKQLDSLSPLTTPALWRDVCDGFSYEPLVEQYKPSRSQSGYSVTDYEGLSKKELRTASSLVLAAITIFDINTKSLVIPYNSMIDRFSIHGGSCKADVRLNFGAKCPLTKKGAEKLLPTPKKFGWLQTSDITSHDQSCAKAGDFYTMDSTYEKLGQSGYTNGFRILQSNDVTSRTNGDLLTRVTSFLPQQDLGILVLMEVLFYDVSMDSSKWKSLTSKTLAENVSFSNNLISTWSKRVSTAVNLQAISDLRNSDAVVRDS